MNPTAEQQLQNPFEQISPIEEQGMEAAAFLGALDDLFDEFSGSSPDRRPDTEIMQMVNGIHDQASQYYSPESARALSLFDQVSQRLGEMACNHDHFKQTLEEHTGLSFGDKEDHKDHSHEHDSKHKNDDEEIDPKTGKKKKKKKSNGFSWWSTKKAKA